MADTTKDVSGFDQDFGGKGRMINLPNPETELQAVPKKYVDDLVGPILLPKQNFGFLDDFLSFDLGTNKVFSETFWKSGVVGTGTVEAANGPAVNHPGQLVITAPDNADKSYIYKDPFFSLTPDYMVVAEAVLWPQAAGASNLQRIKVRFGMTTDITSDFANNLLFMVDKTAAGFPNWFARVTNGGVNVDIDTGVAYVNTATKLRIEYDGVKGKGFFYINDNLVATFDSADMPVNELPGIGVLVWGLNALGVYVGVDYVKVSGTLAGR
jgi:hypothetical protein